MREARVRPETILETSEEDDAPYTSFTGSPSGAWGSPEHTPSGVSAANMEASVAGLVYDSHADDITPGMSNLTNWIEFSGAVPYDAVKISKGKLVFDATVDQIDSIMDQGGVDTKAHETLMAVRAGFGATASHYGLRADSVGAPETHAQAISRGGPWPEKPSKRSSTITAQTTRGT